MIFTGLLPSNAGNNFSCWNRSRFWPSNPAGAGNTTPNVIGYDVCPVHPRRRGEHLGKNQLVLIGGGSSRRRGEHVELRDHLPGPYGSSPQARGTRESVRIAPDTGRFIPAGAGNTGMLLMPSRVLMGSSPQARGTRVGQPVTLQSLRFIPAGAGNTGAVSPPNCPPSVHPRRRGEHVVCICCTWSASGSSPQARGTHAGICPRGALILVHPRRRGEHRLPCVFIVSPFGSSPQARGTRVFEQRVAVPGRFIPAGAGNTASVAFAATSRPGSSPQARGTPANHLPLMAFGRFIPAGAGNTCRVVIQIAVMAVHPRRRGEHCLL